MKVEIPSARTETKRSGNIDEVGTHSIYVSGCIYVHRNKMYIQEKILLDNKCRGVTE